VKPEDLALEPGTPADLAFIRRVHREAMGPHIVEAWGRWDEDAQRERFDRSTDPTTHQIIVLRGVPVGCQWVRDHVDSLELVRLWLLEEAQGQGVGTGVVALLCERADGSALPIRLRVLKRNPARRLYRRMGFAEIGQTESHRLMRRSPRRSPAPADGTTQ